MKRLNLLCLFILIVFSFTACQTLDPNITVSGTPKAKTSRGNGPPPHAPAHGYRAKHQGHELRFDTGLGVYIVVDIPNTYFHNGLYLRLGPDGSWQASLAIGTGWRPAHDREVPSKLDAGKNSHKKMKKKKKK